MEVIGITNEEQDNILRTVAAVMHLGNIQFVKGAGEFEEDSKIENSNMVELTAKQLGVAGGVLDKGLCFKAMKTGKDTIQKVNSVEGATVARDALAKFVYATLFAWLIDRINKSLAGAGEKQKKDQTSMIGVLDIFGFETFDWNSFEQLCINYCNEKLQFHFNEHIFSLEQAEYKAEGIDVSQIQFVDNQPTLDMLEQKGKGIFSLVDEEMNIPKGSDDTLLVKITKAHDGHPNFTKPGVKTNYQRKSFSVIHYAGSVMYNVTGFLEKNTDTLSEDLQDLLKSSSYAFIAGMCKSDGNDKGGRSSVAQKASIGSKFKNQLGLLMKTLNATEPHFIRCIKPNDEKESGTFTAQMVIDQLRYAGLLEVCRIRQIGYPIRKEFKEFFRRYMRVTAGQHKDVKQLCDKLQGEGLLTDGQWQIGKAKVFLRVHNFNDLEARREVALKLDAVKLQKVGRMHIAKSSYKKFLKIIKALQDSMAKRHYEDLKQALIDSGDLPYQGRHLQVFKDGTKLLNRLEEEIRVTKLLEAAIEKRDYQLLQGAIGAAKGMKYSPAVLPEAEKLVAKIEEERAAVKELQTAIKGRKLEDLNVAMEKVRKLEKTDVAEWRQAETLKKRLEDEEAAIKKLEEAAKARDLDQINNCLVLTTEMGIDNPVVAAAQKIRGELMEEQQVQDDGKAAKIEGERKAKVDELMTSLKSAVAAKDDDKISELKNSVLQMGVAGEEVDGILSQSDKWAEEADKIDALMGALETMKVTSKNKEGILASDIEPLAKAVKICEGIIDTRVDDSTKYLKKMEQQLVVQEDLKAALGSSDYDVLKKAMSAAKDLDMETATLDQLIDKIKELDSGRVQETTQREAVEMDEEEFERQRQENLAMASHERYHFGKYYKIRSDADYVKTSFFARKKVAEVKLCYQKIAIPRSILEMDKEATKLAIGIHKSLLGYCGEQLMTYPATLAQDILIKGLENPQLVDEIFIQICKHLTNNPKPESVGRAWQMMCMAVGTFPPSSDFEYYLLNFFIEHLKVPGLVGNYARYCLRRLEGMLIRGASGFVPNIEEILSYKERPPILATIELVDGTPLTEDLPITPDLNVDKVLDICTHFLSLEDERKTTFGIFVKDIEPEEKKDGGASLLDNEAENTYGGNAPATSYSARHQDDKNDEHAETGEEDIGPALPRTVRPLRGKEFLGDAIVQATRERRQIAFVFKRKMFLPDSDYESKDPVYSRLMYLQAADEVISGNFPVTKEADIVDMSAIAIAADAEKFPATEKALLEADLMEYIPVPWRSKKTEQNWARSILAARGKVASKSLDYLQNKFVELAKTLPMYGMSFFYVRKEKAGQEMIAAVSHAGVNFLSTSRVLLQTFKYSDIHRWGGSSMVFWLMVWDAKKQQKAKLNLFTMQARDMSALILDYALLAAKRGAGPGSAAPSGRPSEVGAAK